MIFPWQMDGKVNNLIEHLCKQKMSGLNFLLGVKGLESSFSFLLKPELNWTTSSYLTSALSLGLLLHFLHCTQKEPPAIA